MKLRLKTSLASILVFLFYSCQNPATISTPTESSNVPSSELITVAKKTHYERPKEILRKQSQLSIPYRTIDHSKSITTFGFGSDNDQNQAQPLWKLIYARSPQLFLMMGNIVDVSHKQHRPVIDQYIKLNENPQYLALREAVPFLATWDDQDFSQPYGGEDNQHKLEARKIFGQYWTNLKNVISKDQEAIYYSRMIGEGKKRVQFILLDTRTNRSALNKNVQPELAAAPLTIPKPPPLPTTPILTSGDRTATLKADPQGTAQALPELPKNSEKIVNEETAKMFSPNEDPKAHILSSDQWKWFETELKKPAELRIIVSSIQVLADDHGFEKWGNYPQEKKKFLELLNKLNIHNAVILSGNRHFAAVSRIQLGKKSELFEVTSSALNTPTSDKTPEIDKTYVGSTYLGINFGLAEIDWTKRLLEIQIIGEDYKSHLTQSIKF